MVDAIEQDARFFDYLVELIPARFYHGDGDDRVNLRTMNKAARAAAKQEFKAKAHENKRKKLNPDAPATALEIQQGAAAGASNGTTAPNSMRLGGASLSREELKAKLQQKIESIHHQRSPSEKQELAAQAKAWRQKTLESSAKNNQQQQQQHKAEKQQKRKPESQPDGGPQSKQQRPQSQPGRPGPASDGRAAPETKESKAAGDDDLNFARIDFEEAKPGRQWHKRPTKEQLLVAAEAKQAEITAATATKQGQVRVVNEAWRTALARASGEKVLDDPKLLRRSIKKEVKRKEKSAKQWQERKAAQQGVQDRKQQRRTDNLQARTDTKMANKKNAREKKLLRAGFEGRKEGFIGAAGKKPAA